MACSDLALKEYSELVHSLDPSAVPPITPSSTTSNVLSSPPDLSSTPRLVTPPLTPHTSSESISNLLIGQRGVSQLFNDFSFAVSAKEKALQDVRARVDELAHSISVLKDQLAAETALRVTAQEERARALRDDGSAAKVVERYMIFTQKTHATVHLHLDNLRIRSTATQASLRGELNELRSQLEVEAKTSTTLREALDEMGEGFSREAAGRRREIALRLAMLAEEEKRERKLETWLDRVRKMRDGAEGAVIEPDILESLLDEGVVAVTEPAAESSSKRSWRGLMGRGKGKDAPVIDYAEGSSIARVLLAEEMADTLNLDLQRETDRRLQLEHERVEWLAREATNGVAPELHVDVEQNGALVFSADDEVADVENKPLADETDHLLPHNNDIPRTPSPLTDPSPLVEQLRTLFGPLTDRFTPLQTTLHSLSHSLSTIRSSLPTTPAPSASPSKSRFGDKRSPLLNLSLRSPPTSDPVLLNILDSIHEVIEDARVDVEIALADEERVYRGFEALLGVEKSGAIQGKNVLSDAREYIAAQRDKDISGRLEKRVGDIEHDITTIKTQLHKLEGMEIEVESEDGERSRSIWTQIKYRTVTPTTPRHFPSFPSSPSFLDTNDGDPRKRTSSLFSSVGNVGRSFSASIVGAPRRMGSFAGGFQTRANGAKGEVKNPMEDAKVEDDVE